MKYLWVGLVAVSGFNMGGQATALRYDIPIPGEWWKLLLALICTVIYCIMTLRSMKIETNKLIVSLKKEKKWRYQV